MLQGLDELLTVKSSCTGMAGSCGFYMSWKVKSATSPNSMHSDFNYFMYK